MRKRFGFVRVMLTLLIMVMLILTWWSSNAVEKDLKQLRQEIAELSQETENLTRNLRQELKSTLTALPSEGGQKKKRAHINEAYPNLLEDDPFYLKTLPQIVGEDFQPRHILRQALLGKPEHLHPFNGFRDVSYLLGLCTGNVAQLQFGKYETMAPDLAIKLEKRPLPESEDVYEYWVHLRDEVYWCPLSKDQFPKDLPLAHHFFKRHQVTAHDFKFFYDAVMNPYVSEPKAVSLRTYFHDIEEFKVIDDLTFVVRWKVDTTDEQKQIKYTALSLTGALQPLPCFVYKYFLDGEKIVEDDAAINTYRDDSVWAQNFAHHFAKNIIVSCGPYFFRSMNDEGIYLERNPDHFNKYAVLVGGMHYLFKESFDAIWQEFKGGNLDLCTLSPNQLIEYDQFCNSRDYALQEAQGKKIECLDYVDRCFYYLGWNLASSYFSSTKVRHAMTLAIDCERIIEQNLNQMAINITGPFFCYSPSYNSLIRPHSYNPDLAKRILDEEGWFDMNGDGIRDAWIGDKMIPFRFRLCYFVKSLSAKVIADYIATALRDIGIDCQPHGLDITDLSRQFDDKSFDAIFMGWKLGTPPDDPRQIWHSSGAKEKGSSNAIGFANPEIDRIIEKLNYEPTKERRQNLYHNFHQIIHEETPYTFLYTPKIRLLYREHVRNVFIPRERQDLVPEADISEPNLQVLWLDL